MNFPAEGPSGEPAYPPQYPSGIPGSYSSTNPSDPYHLAYYREYVRGRTRLPAFLMIVVGIFGLLFSIYLGVNTILGLRMSPEEYQREVERLGFQENQFKGWSFAEMKRTGDFSNITMTALAFPTAILQLLAGIRFLTPRSFGLVLFGALSACVPCINITGCCGFGQLAGIWSLIVLMDPTVRAAFHQSFIPFQYPPYPPG